VEIAAEFFGAIGLILGFLTRIAAFGIAVIMLVAIMTVHHAFGFFMNWTGTQKGEGFEYHLLVLAMVAFLMIRGQVPFRLTVSSLSRRRRAWRSVGLGDRTAIVHLRTGCQSANRLARQWAWFDSLGKSEVHNFP